MIKLLKEYPKYLSQRYGITRTEGMNIQDMIDITSYINSINISEREFYSKIFSTQMFIELIYKRMMPKDCNEKVEVLFFEEKISEKYEGKGVFGFPKKYFIDK